MKLAKVMLPIVALLFAVALLFLAFSPVSNAHTEAPTDPTIVAAGDVATCGNPGASETARLLGTVTGTIIALGDYAYESGSTTEFMQCYDPFWGQFKARMHPVAGNHEYLTGSGAAYFQYFGSAAGDPRKGYYSFDLGTWHIIALNSNCEQVGGCQAGSAQEQWLKADLSAHQNVCTLAYWHHPRFSSGEHGSTPAVDAFWRDLYAAGVDVVLNGHDHDYERFAPQNPGADLDLRGIREFVVGTGGASHYEIAKPISHSRIYNTDTYGVLQMVLHSSGYDWQFIPVAGKDFRDSGSATCVGAAPLAYGAAVLDDQPVSYWRLDDRFAVLAHDEAERNDGRLLGQVTPGAAGATKDTGRAMNFAGAHAYISVPDDPSLDVGHDFTLEAWVKPAALDGQTHVIVEKGEGSDAGKAQYQLALQANEHWQGCIDAGARAQCLEPDQPTAANVWTYLALVRQGDTLTLYVGGQSAGSIQVSGSNKSTTSPLAIGRAGSADLYYFDGSIDEVALYDHGLAAERIRAHFDAAGK